MVRRPYPGRVPSDVHSPREGAHRLYRAHGFRDCPPFGDYVLDPHGLFMTLTVA